MQTTESIILKVAGAVDAPREFTDAELQEMPDRVDDIRELGASREGSGVRLGTLIGLVKPRPEARYISFVALHDDFEVCVELETVIRQGVVIHRREGKAMTRAEGGPFRFIIPDPAACGTDPIDECVNVKYLDEIRFSATRGRDTRPANENEHAKLHDQESQ